MWQANVLNEIPSVNNSVVVFSLEHGHGIGGSALTQTAMGGPFLIENPTNQNVHIPRTR